MTPPTLRTSRLVLRPWRETDVAAFARMNADPDVMRYFPATMSREESDASVDRCLQHFAEHNYGFWPVECIDAARPAPFIGIVGLVYRDYDTHFTPAVEVGWRLDATYWNHGYATEAAAACLDFGFATLGLDQIVSCTVPDNQPSRRVMEKLGMTRDPAGDFDHPHVAAGHPMQRHVLYRLSRSSHREASPDSSLS